MGTSTAGFRWLGGSLVAGLIAVQAASQSLGAEPPFCLDGICVGMPVARISDRLLAKAAWAWPGPHRRDPGEKNLPERLAMARQSLRAPETVISKLAHFAPFGREKAWMLEPDLPALLAQVTAACQHTVLMGQAILAENGGGPRGVLLIIATSAPADPAAQGPPAFRVTAVAAHVADQPLAFLEMVSDQLDLALPQMDGLSEDLPAAFYLSRGEGEDLEVIVVVKDGSPLPNDNSDIDDLILDMEPAYANQPDCQ